MEGTNVEEGKKMLEKSGLKIHTADRLEDAAAIVVKEAHNYAHSNR
jgi:succinyl-CoA synthetase beta subunit